MRGNNCTQIYGIVCSRFPQKSPLSCNEWYGNKNNNISLVLLWSHCSNFDPATAATKITSIKINEAPISAIFL